jgi:hypothetical protein
MLTKGMLKCLLEAASAKHGNRRIHRYAIKVIPHMPWLPTAFKMIRQIQKGFLVGIADVRLVAEDSPEHCHQIGPLLLHGRQNPPLRSRNGLCPYFSPEMKNRRSVHTPALSVYQDAVHASMLSFFLHKRGKILEKFFD